MDWSPNWLFHWIFATWFLKSGGCPHSRILCALLTATAPSLGQPWARGGYCTPKMLMLKAHLCISIAPMEEQDISNVRIYQKIIEMGSDCSLHRDPWSCPRAGASWLGWTKCPQSREANAVTSCPAKGVWWGQALGSWWEVNCTGWQGEGNACVTLHFSPCSVLEGRWLQGNTS